MKRSAILRRSSGIAKLSVPVPRTKRCAKAKGGCGEFFLAVRGRIQAACGPSCAESMAVTKRQKAERKADRAKREKLKTRSDWMREAQAAFNAFIRARDYGLPCICCGQYGNGWTRGGEFDAGHYRSRGAAPHLKFDQRNVHAQLKKCNRYASGNVVGYRKGLIERIGLASVEALEADETPAKWSIDDLKAIRDKYRRLARELKNGGEK